jgi:hypothetical protein
MALGIKDSEIVINPDKTGLTGPRLDDGLKELNDAITAESLWDRDATGTPFLKPQNTGDDLNMGTGSGTFGVGEDSVVDVTNSSEVTQELLNSNGDNYSKGLYKPIGKVTLADDAEVTVSTGRSGFGIVNIGDNQEDAYFTFSTTAVTLRTNSTNVANSDTDTNLCIYYSSGNLNIKNRLGSSLDVRYTIWNS